MFAVVQLMHVVFVFCLLGDFSFFFVFGFLPLFFSSVYRTVRYSMLTTPVFWRTKNYIETKLITVDLMLYKPKL